MKIAVGLFYLECNTFNPDLVGREQFIFAEGQQVLPICMYVISSKRRVLSWCQPLWPPHCLPDG